jgi:cytosine/adenosine deaminase-related metal-dependent hydrolase
MPALTKRCGAIGRAITRSQGGTAMSHDHSDDRKPAHKHSGPNCCFSRRGILGIGALGVAGAMLPSPFVKSAAADRDGDDDDDRGRRGRRGRLLLKGGTVFTMLPGWQPLPNTDVLVENGKIREVRPNIQVGNARTIDCRGKFVTPGFVDTHRHMWQGLLRNIGPDDLLEDYLDNILGQHGAGFALHLTPEEAYLGDLVAALSAMNSGITTILDWSHINTTPEHTDAVIKALQDSGIRAVYAYGPHFYHGNVCPPVANPYPGDIYRLRSQYFNSPDQLLTLALAAGGPQFVPMGFAVFEWFTARDVGARISVHVGVGNAVPPGPVPAGQGAVEALHNALPAGAKLGEDTTYIHSCTLTQSEFQLIADTGGSTSLAFPVEMQMGHGTPPIQKCLQLGIPVSLSVDVETNQPTDMFNQMHFCFAFQRELANQGHLHPDTSHRASLLTVKQVLEIATVGGAQANGLAKVGTLAPGNEADILLLNARAINVAPVNDPIGAVVLGMDSSNVDSVFVAGKAIKRNGRLVGVDVERLLAKAEQARQRLRSRVCV